MDVRRGLDSSPARPASAAESSRNTARGPAAAGKLKPEAPMASFENTVTIRRPVEDVFAFLADFENVPAWNPAIVETRKVSPGPVGVGTTYRQTSRVKRAVAANLDTLRQILERR
jgi:Polyketide cyclase / dehydrase and lipid transport